MQLICTFSFLEILRFFLVIEIYIKRLEISNFWLSILISQVAPYLMVILVSVYTFHTRLALWKHHVNLLFII